MHLKDLTYFFIGVILPTYNLLEWLTSHFGKVIIKDAQQAIIYNHSKQRALGNGHKPKKAVNCLDGDCLNLK